MFLPAASSFEKHGTFMNAERRIQRVRPAVAPPGRARSDLEIISAVAGRMGHARGLQPRLGAGRVGRDPERLAGRRGITYERLERGGLCWPCPTGDHPGTQVLYESGFPVGRASLRRIDYRPSPETVTPDYPFLLTTGRTLYQFNAGTMTRRSRTDSLLSDRRAGDRARRCRASRPSRGRTGHGEEPLRRRDASRRVHASVKSGELFATFHDPAVFLNTITGPQRDSVVGAPEYKVTAVRIERTGR